MKTPRMVRTLEHLDNQLIEDAALSSNRTLLPDSSSRRSRNRWIALAASLAVLAIAAAIVLPILSNRQKTAGHYKDYHYVLAETLIVWPWEALTPVEQYTSLTLNGVEYDSRGSGISGNLSEALLSDQIGEYTLTGYDWTTDQTHTKDCPVYQILHVDPSQAVAVEIDGTFCVFRSSLYDPPATLGELFEAADLSEIIELSRFSENGDGPDTAHFMLEDDDPIWETLKRCQDAPFLDDQSWVVQGRSYLSFTVTSEALGIYKKALYITEDGYLWTNAFEWMYLYDIGEEAASEIITYARANAEEAEYEPYTQTLVGQITEITDEYILVDDSLLCRSAKDGLTYRIPMDDVRIMRYVTYCELQVGDFVLVSYLGQIDSENANTISGVLSLQKAYLYGDGIDIPE